MEKSYINSCYIITCTLPCVLPKFKTNLKYPPPPKKSYFSTIIENQLLKPKHSGICNINGVTVQLTVTAILLHYLVIHFMYTERSLKVKRDLWAILLSTLWYIAGNLIPQISITMRQPEA